MKTKQAKNKLFRLEIIGGIAAGKTSFISGIEHLNLKQVIYEEFKMNPFLKYFYENPSLYNPETEISFLLQHYNQIKRNIKSKSLFCDFSILLDVVYAKGTLTKKELKTFNTIFEFVKNHIGLPDVLIYLKCSPEVLKKRILKRGRLFEKNINLDYLKQLDLLIKLELEQYRNTKNLKVVEVNSSKTNYVNDLSEMKKIYENEIVPLLGS
jgi:deoxyguanosine kinase